MEMSSHAIDQKRIAGLRFIGADDKRDITMIQNTKATKYTFGFQKVVDFKGKIITNWIHGLEVEIGTKSVWFRMRGDFNAYNLLGVHMVLLFCWVRNLIRF